MFTVFEKYAIDKIISLYLNQLEWNLFLLRLLSPYEQRYFIDSDWDNKTRRKNKHDLKRYSIYIDCNFKRITTLYLGAQRNELIPTLNNTV